MNMKTYRRLFRDRFQCDDAGIWNFEWENAMFDSLYVWTIFATIALNIRSMKL
jgi:hypothetical protein